MVMSGEKKMQEEVTVLRSIIVTLKGRNSSNILEQT